MRAMRVHGLGEALRLAGQDGLARYADLVALFQTLPRMDRSRAAALAERFAGGHG